MITLFKGDITEKLLVLLCLLPVSQPGNLPHCPSVLWNMEKVFVHPSNNISSQWCPQDAKAKGSALLCTLVYLNWKQPRHIWEEGISAEELPSLDWPAGKSGEAFPWLMIDWGGGQLIPGSATPGFYKKGRWASHRKQANKQHSSWSLLQCLPSVSCLGFPSSWTINLKLNPLLFNLTLFSVIS